ncbi:MAG: HyaD/HybD family hydrogenase maturation endopeptidase [Thiobacillus sp.]|nr:HyaD/HybD family hydrogenase maturation endopeptidase [Thiobacillus sp.]
MRIVVLGVGNILLTDEGVGVYAIEELGRRYQVPPEVELLDGGTSAMELLDDLANSDLLIIADCVRAGKTPGSLLRLKDEEIPALFRTKLSPHQVGLPDVLATLVITHEAPTHTVLFGVEPESLATHMGLTPVVEATLPILVEAIAREIVEAGVPLAPR